MSSIGGYKANRTRALNNLTAMAHPVQEVLQHEEAYEEMDVRQLKGLAKEVVKVTGALKDRLATYKQANATLEEQCVKLKDVASQNELQENLDNENDDVLRLSENIPILTNFLEEIRTQQKNLDMPRMPHPDPQPNMAQTVAQAVAAAMEPLIQPLIQAQAAPAVVAAPAVPAVAPAPAPAEEHNVRLPKIEMEKYSGDIMQWKGFWDQFQSAVHNRANMPAIEKFTYLRSMLTGDALKSVQGLTFDADNYANAVTLLQQRYGNNPLIIDAHYKSLDRLSVTTSNAVKLRSFYDIMERDLRSLESLGQNVEQYSMITNLQSKLPTDVRTEMERQRNPDEAWTMANFRQLLKRDLELRELLSNSSQLSLDDTRGQNEFSSKNSGSNNRPKGFFSPTFDRYKPPHQKASGEALMASERRPMNNKCCVFCEKSHWSDECRGYSTLEARKRKIYGRCFVCFGTSHAVKDCRRTRPCFHCGSVGTHNRALCPKLFGGGKPYGGRRDDSSSGTRTFERKKGTAFEPHVISVEKEKTDPPEPTLLASDQSVLMQTALAIVKNHSAELLIRLLLDCGSNRSYITEALAKKLGLILGEMTEITVVTFGSDKPKVIRTPTAVITLQLKDGTTVDLTVNVVPNITGSIQRVPFSTEIPEYLLNGFSMADTRPKHTEASTIELLIGNDYYLDFILPQKVELQPGLHLLGTKLGWIIAGRIDTSDPRSTETNLLSITYGNKLQTETVLFAHPDASLATIPNMEEFWNLETIGIREPDKRSDGDIAVQKFNETVQIVENRYAVTLPWKDDDPDLSTNYSLAYNRFRSTAKKFQANPELLKKCSKIIQEQLELGIVEKVTSTTPEGRLKHYVPHQPVETPTKTTTKVRIVFDASSKLRKENKSLNDCLYPGPVWLQDLCGLLLRFRKSPIALIADIEKAFLNVGLQIKDRDVTRFFWFQNPENPTMDGNIQIYRFCRIPFGITSSPFLLAATLNHLLTTYGTPNALRINNDIYVDNVITGTETVKAALELYEESQKIFKSASFNLREWSSNSTEFIEKIPPVHRAEGCIFKVLGITWNTTTDCLSVTGFDKDKFEFASTKRQVLQAIASVYDPVGYFTPVTLKAKLFLHSLWAEKMDWDKKLSSDQITEWKAIYLILSAIATYPIQRFVGHSVTTAKLQLLCYCDASALSYATAVYLRSSIKDDVRIDLIFSKTRLAPQEKLSIPRLELLAALIGVRSLNFVQTQLRLPIEKKFLWSDSQCVLHWIRSTKPLSVFVENRVREIRKPEDISFRYVHTDSNPADMATRGLSVEELQDSLWWHGPTWLKKDEINWPTWDVEPTDQKTLDLIDVEARKSKVLYEVGLVVGEDPTEKEMVTPLEIKHENFSSLTKLLRITATCLRFLDRLKSKHRTKSIDNTKETEMYLSALEIKKARTLWELAVQRHWYPDAIQAIKDGTKHNLCHQLGLQLDDDGLLRSLGRYENAQLTEAARRPKLLPKQDHFTKLIIENAHRTSLHSGISQTLATVRQEYWIPQGRSKVRFVLMECRVCSRVIGGSYKLPVMAPWPKERLSQSAPFTFTGLDYLGPLYVRDGPSVKKVWVCLFTCLAVRAIHLELIEDMSTEQFLMCLRRFIACHGKPDQIISDNATQFKLARTTIDKAWANILLNCDIQNYIANKNIMWKFIVEFAPWMGGFYEHMVGLVKMSIKKSIGKLCLSLCQLTTLLSEIQAVINSRPLVYVGDDLNSDIALTPAHFLSLNPRIGIPVLPTDQEEEADPTYLARPISSANQLLIIWKKGQKHLNKFWKIWSDDYLVSLRERTQRKIGQGRILAPLPPKVGDVVIIKENLPRGSWKIAKIQKLVVSKDGEIRSAVVLLPSKKSLNRPLNLLCPIECPDMEKYEKPFSAMKSDPPSPTSSGNSTKTGIIQAGSIYPSEDSGRPKRSAAIQARKNIRTCLKEMVGLQLELSGSGMSRSGSRKNST